MKLYWSSKVFKAQRFKLWCSLRYGTAVEDRSLLNRSGIYDGIICCNIFCCSYSRFEYKNCIKLYWFRNLVRDFLSWDTSYMKCDVTHILTSFKTEYQRYGKGHLEIRKLKIKDANIFNTVAWKKISY
jgi:hypothetical protein